MSNGQMVEDVRLALNGARPVEFYEPHGRQCAIARRRCWSLCAKQALRHLAGGELRKKERMAHV